MASVAEQTLALLTAHGIALAQALKDVGNDAESEAYHKRKKLIDKVYKQGMRKLRKEAKEDKELTDHAKELAALDLTNKTYSKAYVFDSLEAAQTGLRSLSDDWVTGKSGRHGGNKLRQHHGGPYGCFMITTDKESGIATLWVADDNHTDLPENIEGAHEIEDDSEDEGGMYDADLGLLIASAGKTVEEIKEMDTEARAKHATDCDKNRNIKAADVTALAKRMKCPDAENTKLKRLGWILGAFDAH